MTIGQELKKRLAIYSPVRCQSFGQALKRLDQKSDDYVRDNNDKIAGQLLYLLPRFTEDIDRIIPRKQQRKWLARQLELARKSSK